VSASRLTNAGRLDRQPIEQRPPPVSQHAAQGEQFGAAHDCGLINRSTFFNVRGDPIQRRS
jgi:hypothetical protein